jgi:hypothetical protein
VLDSAMKSLACTPAPWRAIAAEAPWGVWKTIDSPGFTLATSTT